MEGKVKSGVLVGVVSFLGNTTGRGKAVQSISISIFNLLEPER
jgi:hypothetical protein